MRGNHHDAWVNGADDPISGQAAMLEEARMLGELHRQGWTPKRTIIYCAWDGEEPGLLGSVEWVEAHVDELKQHAVAYINSDGNEQGLPVPRRDAGSAESSSAGSRAMCRTRRPTCRFFNARIWPASPGRKMQRSATTRASAAILRCTRWATDRTTLPFRILPASPL